MYVLNNVQKPFLLYYFFIVISWSGVRIRNGPTLSCFLALLLPLNDLQHEIRGVAGKNLRKQQFQSNKLNMPSISGAIKDSGAVRFDLASIHKGPQAKETDESRLVNFAFAESETDQIGRENAEEVGRKKLDLIDET